MVDLKSNIEENCNKNTLVTEIIVEERHKKKRKNEVVIETAQNQTNGNNI